MFKYEKRLYKGGIIPFLCLHHEFDKNANSFGVSTKCFSYRYSLATIGVCVFGASAPVGALFDCRTGEFHEKENFIYFCICPNLMCLYVFTCLLRRKRTHSYS